MAITVEEAGRRGGGARSKRKAEQCRLNGKLGGRRPKPLAEFPCTCGVQEAIADHKSTCPRGRAIKRRAVLVPHPE